MKEFTGTDATNLLDDAGLPLNPWEVVGKTFHFICREVISIHHLYGTITGVVITPKPNIELQVSLTRGPGGWPVDYLEYCPPGERDLHELFDREKSSRDDAIEEHVKKGGWMLRTKDGRGKNGGSYGRWRGYLYLH